MNREGLLAAVKKAVDEWNPYLLLPDSPEDEFDAESRSVACSISPDNSVQEIACAVSRVFAQSFGDDGFSVQDCMGVAEAIKRNFEAGRTF